MPSLPAIARSAVPLTAFAACSGEPRDTAQDTTTPRDTAEDSATTPDTGAVRTETWFSDAGSFVQVAASAYHRCALDSAGTASCWGSDLFGKTTPPGGTYSAISVARSSTCAVSTDGFAVCWGCQDDGSDYGFDVDAGQCAAPGDAVSAISAADAFTVALSEGNALFWSESPAGSVLGEDEVPGDLGAIDASSGLCGIREGSADCWTAEEGNPDPDGAYGPYDAITSGPGVVCAGSSGAPWTCWGDGVDAEPYALVDAGRGATCGILASDGSLACFGEMAAYVAPAGAFLDVSVADTYACGARDDGVVVCWGALGATEGEGD